MTLHPRVLILLSSVIIGISSPVAAQGRAIVLDVDPSLGRPALLALGRPALLAVDTASGATLARADLQGQPTYIVRSPDGSRFVIHEPGNGPLFLKALPNARPGADQTIAVIDATSLKVLKQMWLGPAQNASLRDGLFSPDGSRLTLVVDEFRAPDKIMLQHRAIVCLNLRTGELAGWVAVPNELRKGPLKLLALPDQNAAIGIAAEERGSKPGITTVAFLDLNKPAIASQLAIEGDPMWSGLTDDRKFLALVQRMGQPGKNAPGVPSHVRFVDLSTRQPAGDLVLKGSVENRSGATLSASGRYLYLLEAASNQLDVIALSSRTLSATIPVGRAARFSVVGPDRDILVVDDGAAGDTTSGGATAPSTLSVQAPAAPVRVSGNVSPPRKGNLAPPRKIKDVPPVYPSVALSARVQGVVLIEATIGVTGKVTDAKVLRSIPPLDAAALDAVRQWEYAPTMLDGKPLPVIMTVTVNFTLPSQTGTVRLLRDAEVAATAALPARSVVTRSSDGQRLYAWSQACLPCGGTRTDQLVRLTWPGLQSLGNGPVSLPQNSHTVRLTDDGSRAISLNADSSLSIIDLDTGQEVASLETAAVKDPEKVKKWLMFGQGLLFGFAAAVNVAADADLLPVLPVRAPWKQEQESTREILEMRQGFAYVFNPEAGEVVVVDVNAARITEKLPAPGQAMRLVPGGTLLAIEDARTLRLIDTATNKRVAELDFPLPPKTYAPLFLAPLKSGAVLAARGGAASVIDGATGRSIASIAGLRRVTAVLIEP